MFRDPNFSKKSYQNEYKTNNVRWAKYNMANRAYLDLSKSAIIRTSILHAAYEFK